MSIVMSYKGNQNPYMICIPSRELTYPTLGTGKNIFKRALVGDMLVSGRVTYPQVIHQQISRNFQRIHLSLQGLDFVRDRLADSLQLLGAPCGSDPERGKRNQ